MNNDTVATTDFKMAQSVHQHLHTLRLHVYLHIQTSPKAIISHEEYCDQCCDQCCFISPWDQYNVIINQFLNLLFFFLFLNPESSNIRGYM